MKCNICDAEISEKEIQWNPDYKSWEPCGTCIEIALDAAYSDGYSHEEDVITVLDPAFDGDSTDIVHSPTTYQEE